MKNTILTAFLFIPLIIFAQPKEFEGTVVYKNAFQSKIENVGDQAWKNLTVSGDSTVVAIKKGNYRQTSGIADSYYITADQKLYFVFKGIDTLYYLDYSSDTSTVLNISRPNEKKTIAGHECQTIVIKMPTRSIKYSYSPALYMNPEYDKNNTLSRFDAYAKETSSLYLGWEENNDAYTMTMSCTRLQPGTIEESVFKLPDFPRKKFDLISLMTPAEFRGTAGWDKYLQSNLNASLGAKYVKIPRGEKSGTQTAMVAFIVNEKGRIVNARVVNAKEIHPKLAEEALRVVTASPVWKPATVLNGKTIFWYKQLITFQAIEK